MSKKYYESYSAMVADSPENGTLGVVLPQSLVMKFQNGVWGFNNITQDEISQNINLGEGQGAEYVNRTETSVEFTPESGHYYEFTNPLTYIKFTSLPSTLISCAVKFTVSDAECSVLFPENTKFIGSMPQFMFGATYLVLITFGIVEVRIVVDSFNTEPEQPDDTVVATSKDLVISNCDTTSLNGVYKLQDEAATDQNRVWVQYGGTARIQWFEAIDGWGLFSEWTDSTDYVFDFYTHSYDLTAGPWYNAESDNLTSLTAAYGTGE